MPQVTIPPTTPGAVGEAVIAPIPTATFPLLAEVYRKQPTPDGFGGNTIVYMLVNTYKVRLDKATKFEEKPEGAQESAVTTFRANFDLADDPDIQTYHLLVIDGQPYEVMADDSGVSGTNLLIVMLERLQRRLPFSS